MPEKKRVLVLSIDIDDDLGEKARVRGPVVGRVANLDAAAKLALADPEDTDANTIYEAVRTFDELRKTNDVEVAALTGDARLGYCADQKMARQLDHVISRFKPDACVFVSDGASDEKIIPVIQSRIKIDSVKTVVVKQTKELEKTYFVILDKLKEPQFARVVFGVPGVALILWFLFGDPGIRAFVGLLGAYLVLRAAGVEETFFRRISNLEVSFEKTGFIFYFASIPFILVSIWLSISQFSEMRQLGITNAAKLAAGLIKGLLPLLPVAFLIIVAGQALDAWNEKKKHQLPKHAISAAAVVLLWVIFSSGADWVLGATSFADFFYILMLAIVAMILVIYLAKEFKKSTIASLKMEGKEVYSEMGGFLGKVSGVSKRKESFTVQTDYGKKFDLAIDRISDLGEKIVVKY
ncbi:MAG: DUF373 family protein [Candidatus Micrarchaeota archaeon]|nr:DUF373 family protein [Candidatus Micrarchaeota archaeon]